MNFFSFDLFYRYRFGNLPPNGQVEPRPPAVADKTRLNN